MAEPIKLPESVPVLVTILPEHEDTFWQYASARSLAEVWDNTKDDGYAQLLQT